MDPLTVEILGGLVVVLISFVIGWIINKKYFPDKSILSVPLNRPIKKSFDHLNGKWHTYHITRDPSSHPNSFWLYGEATWTIKHHLIDSKVKLHYPKSQLDFFGRGEIRGGRIYSLRVKM